MSCLPDFDKARQRGKIESQARENFVQSSGYPNRPGIAMIEHKSLHAVLDKVHGAGHAICDRLLRAKVCPVRESPSLNAN